MSEAKPDMNKILFMHLVSMLAMSAIQQMGKLVNPATGKAETNLEAAQATIDMLDMIEAKTRGNLDTEEARLLKDTIMSLKMNYVESQDQKTEGRGQKSEVRDQRSEVRPDDGGTDKQTSNIEHPTSNSEGQKSDDGQQTTDDGAAKTGNEEKTPKYHKKYE